MHAVVDECEHGGARLESESLDEALARLEASREGHVELLSFLTRHFGCEIKHLVAALSVDKEEQRHQLIDSLSVHLGCEQGILFLNRSHLIVKFVIVSNDADASIDTCLDLDGTETEHGHCGIGMTVVLRSSKRLCHVLKNINTFFLQEGHDWGNVVADTIEISKHHCLSLLPKKG